MSVMFSSSSLVATLSWSGLVESVGETAPSLSCSEERADASVVRVSGSALLSEDCKEVAAVNVFELSIVLLMKEESMECKNVWCGRTNQPTLRNCHTPNNVKKRRDIHSYYCGTMS